MMLACMWLDTWLTLLLGPILLLKVGFAAIIGAFACR